MFPAAAGGGADRDAGDGARASTATGPTASRRSTTWTSPATRHAALRALRVLRANSTIRWRRQLDWPIQLQRDELTLRKRYSNGLPVRRQLHAVAVEGPRIAGRARQRVRQLRQRRLHRLPDQLVRSGAATTRTSDFDVRHQININWIAELPFGQGKRNCGALGRSLNALIGDWSIAGLMRWTSGFPFNVRTAGRAGRRTGTCRATPSLVNPGVLPETETTQERGRRPAEPVRRCRRRR